MDFGERFAVVGRSGFLRGGSDEIPLEVGKTVAQLTAPCITAREADEEKVAPGIWMLGGAGQKQSGKVPESGVDAISGRMLCLLFMHRLNGRGHRIERGGSEMKAAVVPEVSSTWQIKDVPQPQPGANQVLVKMHASGICYTDVHLTLGHFPGPFPRILGHEPVGEIVAVAPDVTTRKVGDRVGTAWIQSTCGRCEWCQRGRRMFCPYLQGTGIQAQGGHAEYMLMNSDATYLIPDKVSYEQAAPIFCAGYTVYSGLRWADPQPHEKVAVLGIGGLGHLAVQYAKAAGFETIAISHSPDKDKMIRELGADEIVRDGKSLAEAGGADVILSTSNSTKSMVDSIQGLRPDGRLVAMGADAEPLSVSLMDLIMKRIRVIGSQQNGPEYLYEALDYVAKAKVKTIVETYPLAEAAKAYERVAEGKARFRAVLTM